MVEPPGGDPTRNVPPLVDGISPYYAQANAGKRNVGIDLKAPDGAAVLARLAADADVFLENFRPGVLARHGLDADTLTAANPRLVYCSVTGFGQDGPWHDRRAYAPIVHAEVGNLELVARHVVDGFINGMHRSPYFGASVDFAEHRGYVAGDDIRRVDWRLYARTDRFYIKEYEADTNANFSVLLDVSARSDTAAAGNGPADSFRRRAVSLDVMRVSEDTLSSARAGDEDAFRALFGRYAPTAKALALASPTGRRVTST